jgi:VWFA-related protein
MTRFLFITMFFFASLGAPAQSGRAKTDPTPTPTATPRPRIFEVPAAKTAAKIKPTPTVTPTPTPKKPADDEEVIRVESALVPIPVSVTDLLGRAITNLKLEDFELYVNGERQTISDMTRAETPVRLALLFDNSTSVSLAREFEKTAAIRFFRKVLRPRIDQSALFSVATGTRLEQPLTQNVSLLTSAIEAFPEPKGATALLDGIIIAANYLSQSDGRRVIVVVSDGDDNLSDSSLEQTVKSVQANNCQVYVVKTTDFENYKRSGVRGGNANTVFLAADYRMKEIASRTGGAVYSPLDERELDLAFAQISAELSQQYILNYYPDNAAQRRGEFRKIELKIKNRDKLTIRTRAGFYVPK